VKTQTKTNPKSAQPKRRVWIRLAIVLLVLSGIFLALDFPPRLKYSGLKNELVRIDSIVQSSGGSVSNALAGRGDGLWQMILCGPDVHCPYVRQGWVVPIEPGKEEEYIDSILDGAGYAPLPWMGESPCIFKETGHSDFCMKDRLRNSFKVYLTLEHADNYHHKIPTTDISPKQWRYMNMEVNSWSGW